MNRFLDDLCFHCTEQLPPQTSAEYKKLLAEVCALDEKLLPLVGWELLDQYQTATDKLYDQRLNNYFLAGMRFGVEFMLTVFPPHDSSKISAP